MKRVITKVIFLIIIVAPEGQALAQAGSAIKDKEILRCAAIKSSIDRLSCYDAIAKKLGPPVAVNAKQTVGDWTVRSDESRFDDSKSVYLNLTAREEIQGWPGKTYKPYMVVRCKENRTETYIDFGMSAAVEYGLHNRATLRFRIDKKKPFKLATSRSTDGNALFLPEAIGFAKKTHGRN